VFLPLSQRGVCNYPVYHTPIAIAITPLPKRGIACHPFLEGELGCSFPLTLPLSPSGRGLR